MSDRRLVLDIETQRTFDDVDGRAGLEKLGVSVVGVYCYETNLYLAFMEHQMGELQNLLIDASLIIGFNHVQFDMPVLQPYFSIDVGQLPCFDIMLDLQKILGHRIGLDAIASASLGHGKSASGLDAIRYYREGRYEELKAYCLKDVEITKDVFEFGIKNKQIHYRSKYGQQIKDVKVNWSDYGKRLQGASLKPTQAEPAQYKLF